MLIELVVSIVLGLIGGIITGLIPGLHINLIGAGLLYLIGKNLFDISSFYLTIFVISLSISNIFLEFIPSTFLGCPDTETQLAVLPAHELLKQGKAYEAVKLTSLGALTGTIMLVFLFPLFYFFLTKFYSFISRFIFFILLGVFLILLVREKNKKLSFFIFLISGVLGIFTLNIQITEPLLPLFTGLFGISSIIISIKDKIKIPPQQITYPEIKKPIKTIISSLIVSPICGFLPGLGAGQSALLVNILAKTDKRGFLFLNGLINILTMGLSFISLAVIAKTRTGSAVIIKELIGIPSFRVLFLFFICVLITGIISFIATDTLSKKFCIFIEKRNYQKFSLGIIIFLVGMILLISGIGGILILIASTLLGIYCYKINVRKTNLMGCLLLPTLIYYFSGTVF